MKLNARRFLICLALLTALCILGTVHIFAADTTVYLDAESGADTNSGTSAASAFATMDAAINAVQDGGKIVLVSNYTLG